MTRWFICLVALVATAFAAAPAQAAELKGRLTEVILTSGLVPGPVAVSIYTPAGYDPKRPQPYPLLLQLHGGGGSNKNMDRMAILLERAIDAGLVPPMVSVMPSARRSFYMDYRDGSQKWEQFIVTELLLLIRATQNVVKGRKGTFIVGISMGGMGSLRLALKHPDVFQAVASQEPGIEPVLAYQDIQLRDRFYRSEALMEEIYGRPVDTAYWAANNPATIATKDPGRLRGLGIYLEAGDQDMFFLQHGTEFMHRVLFDAGVAHEYRLIRGGDHVGPSIGPRFLDAMTFIGRMIDPPVWVNAEVVAARARIDVLKRAAGYPVAPADPDSIRMK